MESYATGSSAWTGEGVPYGIPAGYGPTYPAPPGYSGPTSAYGAPAGYGPTYPAPPGYGPAAQYAAAQYGPPQPPPLGPWQRPIGGPLLACLAVVGIVGAIIGSAVVNSRHDRSEEQEVVGMAQRMGAMHADDRIRQLEQRLDYLEDLARTPQAELDRFKDVDVLNNIYRTWNGVLVIEKVHGASSARAEAGHLRRDGRALVLADCSAEASHTSKPLAVRGPGDYRQMWFDACRQRASDWSPPAARS